MDKNNAINLIQETFNYPFTENNYLKFSKNLIDDLIFNSSPTWKNNKDLPINIKSKVNRFKNIGSYEYKNGERIAIVSVELDSESTVNKSRFLQRDFSKWFIDVFFQSFIEFQEISDIFRKGVRKIMLMLPSQKIKLLN